MERRVRHLDPSVRGHLGKHSNNLSGLRDWRWPRVELDAWPDRQNVDAINFYGRHQIKRGDTIIIRRFDGSVITHVRVNTLQMADKDTLTAEDIERLAYLTHTEFMQDWGKVYAGKVWLLSIDRITPQTRVKTLIQ